MSPRVRSTWQAWAEKPLELEVPDGWSVSEYGLPETPVLCEETISEIINGALDRRGMPKKIARAASACVLVDDVTRPAAWAPVLAALLDGLNARGLTDEKIRILTALACHAPMNQAELRAKLGEAPMGRVRVDQHSLEAQMTWSKHGGKPVGLNRIYAEADLKIALGSIIPHPFAGFSGGGKAVMPGVADLETIRRNHFLVAFGRGRVAECDNPIRRQMDEIAEASGLDLWVGAVCDGQRRIASLHAGPMRAAFAEAVAFARPYCAAHVERPHSVIVLNAWPKDGELLQVSNAFNVLRTLPPEAAEAWRAVVLVARLEKGLGHHGLFGPGGRLYKKPAALRHLKGRPLLVYAPNLAEPEFHEVFAAEYRLFHDWHRLMGALEAMDPPTRDIGVFHQAAMQTAEGNPVRLQARGRPEPAARPIE